MTSLSPYKFYLNKSCFVTMVPPIEKPPDADDPQFDMEITAVSENAVVIHPPLPQSQGLKRARTDSLPNNDREQLLHQLCNENLLPTVDTKNYCSGCNQVADPLYVLRCCDCNRRFHGNCETLPKEVRKKKKEIMPSQSHIKYYNEHCVAKVNGDYLGGRFMWVCCSCVALKESASRENAPDRYALLETIVSNNAKQQEQVFSTLNETLKAMSAKMEELSFASVVHRAADNSCQKSVATSPGPSACSEHSSHSGNVDGQPWRMVAASKGHASKDTHSCSKTSPCDTTEHSSSSLPPPSSSKFNFRVRVYTTSSDISILSILKDLSRDGTLECFQDFRSRGKSTLDFLFKTGEEAQEAYSKINAAFEPLHNANCFTPDLINSQRAFLVGVSPSDDADSIRKQIHSRYPELQLTTANLNNFKVLPVKECKNKESGYRSTVFFSHDLYRYISTNLNNRLRMGNYDTWSIYPCRVDRCDKCQSFKHSTEQCKARSPVCANCSGNHWTRKCKAEDADICCINCKRSEEHKDKFMGHTASSSECPVYLSLTKN